MPLVLNAFAALVFISGCTGVECGPGTHEADGCCLPDEPTEDLDHDGFAEFEGDCDDSDPNISPTATDIVGDGIDQNCDGNDPDSGEDGGDAELRQTCGCGSCDTVSGASAVWLWMLGLLGVVWRRRSA